MYIIVSSIIRRVEGIQSTHEDWGVNIYERIETISAAQFTYARASANDRFRNPVVSRSEYDGVQYAAWASAKNRDRREAR